MAAPESSDQPLLPPLPGPIGVLPSFVASRPTTLVLKERILSWSGEDFHIRDVLTNETVLRVSGKVWSMSGAKKVMDAQGVHLFTIKREKWAMVPSFYAEDPSGGRFLDVIGKWSCEFNPPAFPATYLPTRPKPRFSSSAGLIVNESLSR